MKTLLLLILSWLSPSPVTPPAQTAVPQLKTVVYQDATFAYEVFYVNTSDSLHLIPNYTNQVASQDLITANSCRLAINGGFYAQDNQPLGLVLADSTEISQERPSQLFNGFVSVSSNNDFQIDENYPSDAKLILQSGPRLIVDDNIINLTLHDDKLARRMVAAKTTDGRLAFMAIFHPQTEVAGPLLDDLPTIVKLISDKENAGFVEAINLDGGSASTFYSPNLNLPEIKPVGSLFCIQ